jgi:hypothetical protein
MQDNGNEHLYYTRKVSFFLQFLDFIPDVRDDNGNPRVPSELKQLDFSLEWQRDICLAALSSSLFYWYFIVNSDCRNLNRREVTAFPIPASLASEEIGIRLRPLLRELMQSFRDNSELRTVRYGKTGNVTVQYFNFRLSKPIIDQVDVELAPHYRLTAEELDYIINYDIKYRMGGELGVNQEHLGQEES